jgi:predicted S18 family serine protease
MKLLFIFIFLFFYFYVNNSFINKIHLLAVNEKNDGKIQGGSVIPLELKIKRGTGEIFVNLNHVEEVDTQISLINSLKLSCEIFNLNCEEWDFYFSFDSNSILLKGPSASSAIAILVAKTIKKEKLKENEVAITGSLNAGGFIGNVGGVEEKIKIAKEMGFKKVLIPEFSEINKSFEGIEVIKVLDIVDAYNNFNGKKYYIQSKNLTYNEKIQEGLKDLSLQLCERTLFLKKNISNLNLDDFNYSNETNKEIENLLLRAEKNYNSSIKALNDSKYYSAGSFCFGSNINYNTVLSLLKNKSEEEIDRDLNQLFLNSVAKYNYLNSNEFKSNIISINDLYVYLILQNRLFEAKENLEKALKLNENKFENFFNSSISNKINVSNNETINISINNNIEEKRKKDKIYLQSFAEERLYTVDLWEKLLIHSGNRISLDETKLNSICSIISRQIYIDSELLSSYNINLFDDEVLKIKKISSLENSYLCVYNGLELLGKINTLFLGMSIFNDKNQTIVGERIDSLFDLASFRISSNNQNNEFPLIPYMYYEYGNQLLNESDTQSALLYLNYALTFSDINTYLKEKSNSNALINETLVNLMENPIFIFLFLVIIAFFN